MGKHHLPLYFFQQNTVANRHNNLRSMFWYGQKWFPAVLLSQTPSHA